MDFNSIAGMPVFNSNNFALLAFKFAIDLAAIFVIARLVYFPIRKHRGYLFTFCIFNIVIFLVCSLLNHLTLSIGFSFGIFAIFSILRYRTMTIPIKEMTYLFIAISLSIINALSNNSISIAELLFTNLAIVGFTYLLEKIWMKNELVKLIIYERIENVKPEKRDQLMLDLKDRTGLEIHRLEIGKIDFLRDIAEIRIYYYSAISNGFIGDGSYNDDDD
jgi:hypothetical protein